MTSLRFAAVIGEIDDNYTESAVKKTVGLRTKRILAAAACFLAAGLVAFGLIQAKVFKHERKLDMTVSIPEDAVLPPAREPGTEHASYVRSFTFQEAFDEADAVCIITVQNYLGRDEWSTDFEATVEKTYKGDLPEAITLRQWADTKGTIPFTYGDKLLVYLVESTDGIHPEAYEILGGDIGYLYLTVDRDGAVYLIDLKGLLSLESSERDRDFKVKNRSGDTRLIQEIREYFTFFDPKLADIPQFPQIYSLEDFENHMNP